MFIPYSITQLRVSSMLFLKTVQASLAASMLLSQRERGPQALLAQHSCGTTPFVLQCIVSR